MNILLVVAFCLLFIYDLWGVAYLIEYPEIREAEEIEEEL